MAANGEKITNLINTTSSYLPPDVILVSISQIDKEILVKGQSFTERAIAQFIANLESSKIFSEVSLRQVDTNQRDGATMVFALKLTLKEDK